MKVLCLAGAWCGDCVNQCPIFQRFAEAASQLEIRYFDRDQHADLQMALKLCGGNRVPVLVFLSEDDQFLGLYGDRTLAKYRQMAVDQLGACVPDRNHSAAAGVARCRHPRMAQRIRTRCS